VFLRAAVVQATTWPQGPPSPFTPTALSLSLPEMMRREEHKGKKRKRRAGREEEENRERRK
jgi:hypothetical protein